MIFPGQAFMINNGQGFGCVISVNKTTNRALVLMQSKTMGEIPITVVEAGTALLKELSAEANS